MILATTQTYEPDDFIRLTTRSGFAVKMATQVDALLERVDQFFMARGPVHKTMRNLARLLEDQSIDYAVIGGMALVLHGYQRLTVDVDLLMTREGLAKFVELLVGRGYAPAFQAAKKHFRDVETGVKVDSSQPESIRVMASLNQSHSPIPVVYLRQRTASKS